MKIGEKEVTVFKVKNRRGFAAICDDCLTEGDTEHEALDRMMKAINRVERKVSQQK